MTYLQLLSVHITCVALSGAGFAARGGLMLARSPLLDRRWLRVLPHVIDTVLLASAIGLAIWSKRYPLVDHWLTAKVAGLLAYVVLGSLALRRGRSLATRACAFGAALAVLAYIVGVAISKSPWAGLA
jgi:uncharacterized membrane protein SirB2